MTTLPGNPPSTALPPRIVVDTSVLMDIEFVHRGRHGAAKALALKLRTEGYLVVIPAHWFFEYMSAVMCEHKRLKAPLEMGEFKQGFPFLAMMLPIDEEFIRNYLIGVTRENLIDLKSGDMIFAAIAQKDRLPLITEDKKLHQVARQLGIKAFTIEEFLREPKPAA